MKPSLLLIAFFSVLLSACAGFGHSSTTTTDDGLDNADVSPPVNNPMKGSMSPSDSGF